MTTIESNIQNLESKMISIQDLEPGLVQLVIDRPDDRVNAINAAFIQEFSQAIGGLRTRPDLKGVIVSSGKPDQWIAGADLEAVLETPSAGQAETAARAFQMVLSGLASLPCTVVAVINGPALGGGCEVALACDYRVAVDSPRVSIGQPEVQLGLIPAGGGCQRLPRLVGLLRGLDLILTGRRLNARRALRVGLVDEVVHPAVLLQAAIRLAHKPKPVGGRQKAEGSRGAAGLLPSAGRLLPAVLEATPLGRQLIYKQARDRVQRETRGHYPAPLAALQAIRIGRERGMAEGLEAEARAFGQLAIGQTARSLIRLFLATQHQRRAPVVDEPDVQPRTVERVGIVGAGFMGSAIAQACAAEGLAVRMRDVSPQAVARGIGSIHKLTREGAQKGRFSRREAEQVVRRVSATTDYSGFARTDLVIEAVFEDLEAKQRVVRELEQVLRNEAVIASNTSALPIGSLAEAAAHPERVVGMHFFSPVHRMPLLEVIRAPKSAPWAVATAVEVGRHLGKTVIVVNDGPGFYTSRVIAFMLNEAGLLLEEGYAIATVDRTMTAFGFPVGPFVLLDEVGLDVAAHAGHVLREAFGDRLAAQRGVDQLVQLGHLGRKSGQGFYRYGRRGKEPDPEIYRLLGNHSPSSPRRARGDDRRVQDRLAMTFVNEAVRCLDEGVLRSPVDGDLGAVLGLGFPPFLGGPFRYVDQLGASEVVRRLEALRQQHGDRFTPASRIIEMAERDERFYE